MKQATWILLVILLNVIFSWATNFPQNVGDDVPAGKLKSLSYAPFREGQDPMLEIFPNEKQIDEDLELLGKVTYNIRTYASAEGSMPLIPDLAKKHGLTMLQGGWLGAYKANNAIETAKLKAKNDLEIAELIRSANEHPEIVTRVIVGNEVLLRGDLEPEELIAYIRQVKRAVKQPVSYADVWSMYMKYPELIKEVDFITIHILPYWEDEPIAVSAAPSHIERIYKQVQREAKSMNAEKPILIGESGWPSGGKQRGNSVPSVVNEARFIRDFIKIATENNFDYNIVEAFNQPWKAAFEGVIGAKWGLYNSSREQVFPLTGLVYENPHWHKNLLASILLFLLILIVFKKEWSILNMSRLLSFLVIAQILTVLFVSQAETLWITSYTHFQRFQTLAILSFNLFFVYFTLQRIINIFTKQTNSPKLSKCLYFGLLATIAYAAIKTVILAWDGRYVDFPTVATQLVVFSLISLIFINRFIEKIAEVDANSLFGHISHKSSGVRIGYWILGLSVALIIGESYSFIVSRDLIMAYPSMFNRLVIATLFTFTNFQLLLWLAYLILLAIPFFAGDKLAALKSH